MKTTGPQEAGYYNINPLLLRREPIPPMIQLEEGSTASGATSFRREGQLRNDLTKICQYG